MNKHADKTEENKSRSNGYKNPQKQGGSESTFKFVDNRSETAVQRKLKDMANNGVQAQKAVQLKATTNNSHRVHQPPHNKENNNTVIQRNIENEFDNSAVTINELTPEGYARMQANALTNRMLSAETDYVFKGLGGGGAKFYRSKEVRKFRDFMKTKARIQAFNDVDTEAANRSGTGANTPAADFEQMVGGNIAYGAVKPVIDDQLRYEASQIVSKVRDEVYQAFKETILSSLKRNPDDFEAAGNEAERVYSELSVSIHAKITRLKDEVVGKRESALTEGRETTEKGATVVSNVVDKVKSDEVGKKSLEQAINAPSINRGMKILGTLIDNVIPGSGETVELKITFIIPTGQPGLNVEINLMGMAARGIDGATTAGVATLGDPNRVEVSAKLSVGVGAEAIGIKSSGAIGVFVRAGSNNGTEHALQALSYGAYRGAPGEAFQNLWAPEDKATEVRKKVNKKNSLKASQIKPLTDLNHPDSLRRFNESGISLRKEPQRTKRQRAEIWAAMIEQKYFKGTGEDTFADVGLSIDGSLGVNFGAAEMELGVSEGIFSRYNEKILKEAMAGEDDAENLFSHRVLNDRIAKERRDKAKGKKILSLGGSVGLKIGAGPHVVELSLSISGVAANNWGVEIVGGASTKATEASPTNYDKIMNGWVTGLGEMMKKLRTTVSKHMNDDETGVWGNMFQLLADGTAIADVAKNNGIRSAMATATESTSPVTPGVSYGTAVGDKIKDGAVNKASALLASTMLQFVLTFGNSGGKPVVRFELRSKRGIDIGGGSPVKVSASKTTRLFAIGKELDGAIHGEILGGRVQ